MNSPLTDSCVSSDDVCSNMISNLEERLHGTDDIFKVSVSSQEIRYKEQMEKMEKIINDLKSTKETCKKIENEIDIDSIIASEFNDLFSSI